jgi:two-component system, NtrC family, response regulator HydG
MHRTALLTNSQIVSSFYLKKEPSTAIPADKCLKSIPEVEREQIIATLKSCNWKVYGAGGAAELLKIHVPTLNSKIKKLGIDKNKMITKNM